MNGWKIFTSDTLKTIHNLLYYSTVNFNRKFYLVFSTVEWLSHILIRDVLKEITPKMATLLAETCWCPQYNQSILIRLKWLCWSLIHFMYLINVWKMDHNKLYIYIYIYIYRLSQEECARLREGVSYVKLYRYNPKHLCSKLSGYGDNGQRKVWFSGWSKHCTCQLTTLSMSVLECGFILRQFSSRSL